jgi:hypothetical protein
VGVFGGKNSKERFLPSRARASDIFIIVQIYMIALLYR